MILDFPELRRIAQSYNKFIYFFNYEKAPEPLRNIQNCGRRSDGN